MKILSKGDVLHLISPLTQMENAFLEITGDLLSKELN